MTGPVQPHSPAPEARPVGNREHGFVAPAGPLQGRANRTPPPLSVVNGRVFTADPRRPFAEAVGMRDGLIAAVGSSSEVLSALPDAEVIDAGGRSVLPGLIDAHNHFLATGESLGTLDVRFPGVASLGELLATLEEAAKAAPVGAYVHAHGYDDAKYERAPTRADLDRAAPSNPLLVGHVSGHYVAANSLAMASMGVADETPDPPGGELVRDGSGRPTGVFRDAAMELVQPTAVDVGHHGPNFHLKVPIDRLVTAVERAGRAFVAAGLTTVCDAQVTSRELAAYEQARAEGRLALRTVCMPLSSQLETYESVGISGPLGDEWLSIGAMKFYCDGSLIGGTAAFTTPYGENGELAGYLFWEPEQFEEAIERAHRSGWQIGVHAQGDRAIEVVLRAFERAQQTRRVDDPRFRIEHAGFPTPPQLRRMAALGVIAVCQPSYLKDSGDDFLVRLGKRAQRLQPLREALRSGVKVVLSSDSDVASYRPLETMAAAVCRQTLSGRPIGTDQALTIAEAITAHTISAAWALRAEDRLGSIETGKLADVVVVGGDLFSAAPTEIAGLPIDLTVIGGCLAHRQ
ncbi:MAG: amidohydrolase [Acidimicrobiales bacterium]